MVIKNTYNKELIWCMSVCDKEGSNKINKKVNKKYYALLKLLNLIIL